ncbi:MAG: hypothetical protein ACO27R_06235, partial [Hylemonella sp.]
MHIRLLALLNPFFNRGFHVLHLLSSLHRSHPSSRPAPCSSHQNCEQAQRQSQQAAGLGTKVHNSIEKYIKGQEWDTFGTNLVSILARKM